MAHQFTDAQTAFLEKFLNITVGYGEGGAANGLVAKRRFLVTRWQQIQLDLDAELKKLSAAIAAKVPEEDAEDVAGGVNRALGPLVAEVRDRLQDAVDEAVNAGDQTYAAVSVATSVLRRQIVGDELIGVLRSTTLMAGAGFERALTSALDEIEAQLTA